MCKIAYICDGYDKCSLEPGCFLREDPLAITDHCCHHTLDPKHAVNDICNDPENHPERFVRVLDTYNFSETVKYYELMPGEESYYE